MDVAKLDLAELDWARIGADLQAQGYAVLPALLPQPACVAMAGLYDDATLFRKRIIMQAHGYGSGEYQYFAYALPDAVQALRTALYPPLATIANAWSRTLGWGVSYPKTHAAFLQACHAAGQTRPTPLLLRYGPGDYNCLHQDLYGALMFPLQLVVLLSRPGADFEGGEFVLVEQRPRRQSRAEVVPLAMGDAVIFAVNQRPAQNARGATRVAMRHGVSRLRSGQRHTLGVIFHDAA